jgi:hypothetical protein
MVDLEKRFKRKEEGDLVISSPTGFKRHLVAIIFWSAVYRRSTSSHSAFMGGYCANYFSVY